MQTRTYKINMSSHSDFDEMICEVEFEGNILIIIADEKRNGRPTIVIEHQNQYPYRRFSKNYIDNFGIDADILIRAIQDGVRALNNY